MTAKQMGKRGGKARALALTPLRRQEIARRAAKVRWGLTNAPVKGTRRFNRAHGVLGRRLAMQKGSNYTKPKRR